MDNPDEATRQPGAEDEEMEEEGAPLDRASSVASKAFPISTCHSKPCRCCLCGSASTDASPLVTRMDEALELETKRPWAKYRKAFPPGEDPVRVPEGRLCLPCLNVFRLLGRGSGSSGSRVYSFQGKSLVFRFPRLQRGGLEAGR